MKRIFIFLLPLFIISCSEEKEISYEDLIIGVWVSYDVNVLGLRCKEYNFTFTNKEYNNCYSWESYSYYDVIENKDMYVEDGEYSTIFHEYIIKKDTIYNMNSPVFLIDKLTRNELVLVSLSIEPIGYLKFQLKRK